MKEVSLTPIRDNPREYEAVRDIIVSLFKKEIYIPLILSVGLKKKALTNASDDLLNAIQSGQISYSKGKFTGRFNSTLSRELRGLGALWDRKHGSWNVPLSKLSIEIKNAISLSESKFTANLQKLFDKISKIDPAIIAEKFTATNVFDTVLFRVEKDFQKSVKKISVAPIITSKRRKDIADGYTKNLRTYIKEFTEEETLKLRKAVEKSVFKGNRYEGLIDSIQKSYGVSYNKAKFLARQETNLMTAKYKESRYLEAGLPKYKWRCVHGSSLHPVRPYHKRLDGTLHTWDNPPIVDEKGNRKHPGEDYGCRCIAIPVVQF